MKNIAVASVCESKSMSFDGELNRIFRELDARGVPYTVHFSSAADPSNDRMIMSAHVLYEYRDGDSYVV